MSDAAKIEAYLAALPGEKRVVMDDWRRRIRTLVPDAAEAFSYSMPALNGRAKALQPMRQPERILATIQ